MPGSDASTALRIASADQALLDAALSRPTSTPNYLDT
jgi:hypothetical protein